VSGGKSSSLFGTRDATQRRPRSCNGGKSGREQARGVPQKKELSKGVSGAGARIEIDEARAIEQVLEYGLVADSKFSGECSSLLPGLYTRVRQKLIGRFD
jgi:hypothetical protein